jgi:hypothetical protein
MECLTHDQKDYILKELKKRFQFLISEAHLMSYVLDPIYLGDSLTRLAKENVEDLILGFD